MCSRVSSGSVTHPVRYRAVSFLMGAYAVVVIIMRAYVAGRMDSGAYNRAVAIIMGAWSVIIIMDRALAVLIHHRDHRIAHLCNQTIQLLFSGSKCGYHVCPPGTCPGAGGWPQIQDCWFWLRTSSLQWLTEDITKKT